MEYCMNLFLLFDEFVMWLKKVREINDLFFELYFDVLYIFMYV